ncbi:MAG: hypothetical protein IT363_05760 [Methanoregulaceae archaeon]|nr:hypothetical protein [Methanoregulaceae archaeon]
MIPFEFEADRGFFTQLLCREGEMLDDDAELFDFESPAAKRAAFAKTRGDIRPPIASTRLHVVAGG